MDKSVGNLIKNWQRHNISGFYFDKKEEAKAKILEIIPQPASIGISGSRTLDELDIVKLLESRGNKIFNQYKSGLSREENLELRRQGVLADYYLASANALSLEGELVFFSAFGNRIAGVSYARNTIVVCGINKITKNLEEAIKRARVYVTPLNCQRLDWNTPCAKDRICRKEICLFPDSRRMCCQILIIEAEVTPDRLKVILVGEDLGF